MPTDNLNLIRSERVGEKKTPESAKRTQTTSEKKYVQTNLLSSQAINRDAQKKRSSASADLDSPCGAPDILDDLKKIQQSLKESDKLW
jgi:hypothetical protein